jgi:hypothetical protein
LERFADGDQARLEVCYPDGGSREAIQRSLVIDDTIWTMTPSLLQGNDVDTFRAEDRVNIA